MRTEARHWCILRTSSANTLKLADGLNAIGIPAYAPLERRYGRKPRTRARYDKAGPLLPCYVFADADRVQELFGISADLPAFQIYLQDNHACIIPDSQLADLRKEEARLDAIYERNKAKGRKAPVIEIGTQITPTEGAFAGLPGVVESQRGQWASVRFEGIPGAIKISSLLLSESVPRSEQSCGQ